MSGFRSVDPMVIKVRYDQNEFASQNSDPSNLSLARYDPERETWVTLPTEVDANEHVLSIETTQLGLWGVLAGTPLPIADSDDGGTPFIVWAILGAIFAGGGVGAVVIIRQRLGYG